MASDCLQGWRPIFCCYERFVAVGVRSFSAFVGVAGGGRAIAVMNAVLQESGKNIGKPKGDIGRLLRGRKPTVRRKTVAVMV
jgi:hypothetical protein